MIKIYKMYVLFYLVENVEKRDVLVLSSDKFAVLKEVQDVEHCRGHPSSPLVVEFIK